VVSVHDIHAREVGRAYSGAVLEVISARMPKAGTGPINRNMEAIARMDKTFNIKVKGHAVTLQTDQKKHDALDEFILTLLFSYYRDQPDRLRYLVETINANYELRNTLKVAK
jgi:hypothetical protein